MLINCQIINGKTFHFHMTFHEINLCNLKYNFEIFGMTYNWLLRFKYISQNFTYLFIWVFIKRNFLMYILHLNENKQILWQNITDQSILRSNWLSNYLSYSLSISSIYQIYSIYFSLRIFHTRIHLTKPWCSLSLISTDFPSMTKLERYNFISKSASIA